MMGPRTSASAAGGAASYSDLVIDLVLQQRYVATEAEDASAAMQAVFGVGAATVESLGSLRYEQHSLVDDGISATRISSAGALLRVDAEPNPDMVAVAVRSGYLVLQQGSRTVALEAGDLGLIPLDQPIRASWEQVAMDLYSFPRSSLGHLLGSDAEQLAVRVARLKAASPSLVALWLRTADLLRDDVLQDPELYSSDVIREQTIDSLLGLTIEAFGISDVREDDTADDETRVQRATAFMTEHLHQPLSMTDVARTVGVSIRGLQLAFQRTGRSTPLAHLRALRMATAHKALTSATDQGPAAVDAIAAVAGYSNLGRFTAHYRQAFNETPLETLDSPSTVGRRALDG